MDELKYHRPRIIASLEVRLYVRIEVSVIRDLT